MENRVYKILYEARLKASRERGLGRDARAHKILAAAVNQCIREMDAEKDAEARDYDRHGPSPYDPVAMAKARQGHSPGSSW